MILPLYNEAGNVDPLLQRLSAVRERSDLDLDVLAVDDGSRDDTLARLSAAASTHGFVRVVRHATNRGMAAALRTGISTALAQRRLSYDALAFMDADLTHAPEDLPRLLGPIADDRADLVLGSRYVAGGHMQGVPWMRQMISIVGNGVVRRALRVPVADLTSGFRAVRTDVFRGVTLEEEGFGIQLEATLKVHRAGFRVAEVPITLGVRTSGYSKMAYTRSFWLGYLRLIGKLWRSPRSRAVSDEGVAAFAARRELVRAPVLAAKRLRHADWAERLW